MFWLLIVLKAEDILNYMVSYTLNFIDYSIVWMCNMVVDNSCKYMPLILFQDIVWYFGPIDYNH